MIFLSSFKFYMSITRNTATRFLSIRNTSLVKNHHFLLLIFCMTLCAIFCSCGSHRSSFRQDKLLVGGDRDAHQCIPSAGYQWSELKKECIRPFELPLKLLNADKTYGAYVCFSNDNQWAEVFAPEGHFLLHKTTDNSYILSNQKSVNIVLKNIQVAWKLDIHNGQVTYVEPTSSSIE